MAVMRHHPEAQCEQCPLYGAGKYVPSAFPTAESDKKIAFIGEAGGAREARVGVPFTGPSGELLDRVLKHYGLSREEVFLGNVVGCRTPDNTTPARSAIDSCRPRILAELREAGITDVAALGNTASQSLLRTTVGVTALRVGPGQVNKEGFRVVSTFHPAACLRRAEMFPDLVTDVGKLVNKPPAWHEPVYKVAEDEETALSLIEALKKDPRELVAFDIEVDIDKDKSFDHPQNHKLLCVGLAYDYNKAIVIGEAPCGSEKVMDALYDMLMTKKLIGQNGKFDVAGLIPKFGVLPLYFDTMLASYCLDERQGVHGLKHMAVEFLGAPRYDNEIKKYVGPNDGYGVIPRPVLYKYNAYDVCCTFALAKMFEERLEKEGLRGIHDFLLRASEQLIFVEYNGIGVDLNYTAELAVDYENRLRQLEEELNDACRAATKGVRKALNPRSPMQVKAALKEMGIQVESTDADTLEYIRDHYLDQVDKGILSDANALNLSFVEAMLRYRFEHKQYSTYVIGIRKRTRAGRVHPTFLLHGTTTGRLSCRNPNLQNIPRDKKMRRMFIPTKPDNIFVQGDYAQAELRVLAFLAQDRYFTNIFNDGTIDVFDDLTPRLYPGARKDLITPAEWKELRIRVKAFVYGLNYGRTEFSIAREFGIPLPQAREMRDRFFSVIPEIVQFRSDVLRKVHRGEDLVSPFGRHRRFYLITKENRANIENEALAFLPQSTASDICLTAMMSLRPQLKGTGIFIRNLVHDSILLEGPEERLDDMRQLLKYEMLKAATPIVGDYVKFGVDVEVGKSWGDLYA